MLAFRFCLILLLYPIAFSESVNLKELMFFNLIKCKRDQGVRRLVENNSVKLDEVLFLSSLNSFNGLKVLGKELSTSLNRVKSGRVSRNTLISLFKKYHKTDNFGEAFSYCDVFSGEEKIKLNDSVKYPDGASIMVEVFLRCLSEDLTLSLQGQSLSFEKLSTFNVTRGANILEAASMFNLPYTAEYLLNNIPGRLKLMEADDFNELSSTTKFILNWGPSRLKKMMVGSYMKLYTLYDFAYQENRFMPKKLSLALARHEKKVEKIAPNKFEADFTFADLEKIIKSSDDIDAFFQKLKSMHYGEGKKIMQNFTFVHKTRSLQNDKVSPLFPRVVRFNKYASLVMAYVSNQESKHANSLEIINFDQKKAKFDFYKVDFPEKKIQKNPKVCAQCHAGSDDQDLKPIWPSYPLWKGMFGEDDDHLSKDEVLQYLAFRAKNKDNLRISSLPFPSSSVNTDLHEKFSHLDLINNEKKFNELLQITIKNPYVFYPYLIHAKTVEDFNDEHRKMTSN